MSLTDPRGFIADESSIIEVAPNPMTMRMGCLEMAIEYFKANGNGVHEDAVMALAKRMWTFAKDGK